MHGEVYDTDLNFSVVLRGNVSRQTTPALVLDTFKNFLDFAGQASYLTGRSGGKLRQTL